METEAQLVGMRAFGGNSWMKNLEMGEENYKFEDSMSRSHVIISKCIPEMGIKRKMAYVNGIDLNFLATMIIWFGCHTDRPDLCLSQSVSSLYYWMVLMFPKPLF